MEALVNITTAHCQDVLLQLLAATSSRQSGAELTQHGLGIKYSIRARCPRRSEGALEQAVAPTARGTDLLGAEPLHHVAGVAAVAAGEAEVGGAAHGHVADGALEGEALAHGALGATHLAAAVAAVHAKLCQGNTHTQRDSQCWNHGQTALLTAPYTAQSSTRMGGWLVFRDLGLFSTCD